MKYSFLVVFFALIFFPLPASSSEISIKELFHVTGCENGTLVVPIVNMWSAPGGLSSGATVVGKLSGDGNPSQGLKCQGAIVRAVEVKNVNGRTFIKVKSIVNSGEGWITDSFVGNKFPKSKCKQAFTDADQIKNCLQ